MIQRADRPFLGIWRGDREFTELRRGSRVLWRKDVPEEPKEKLTTLTVTAASYADLALLDFVRWAIGQGYAGHVSANIAGEAHTLAGIGQLLTVRSEMTANDGRTAELAIGEGSELHEESLQIGDVVAVKLTLEAGEMWLPKVIEDGVHVADPLPCLLPDGRWTQLVGIAYRVDSGIVTKTHVIKRTIKLSLNGVPVGTAACAIDGSCKFERVWSFSLPETELNTVLAETAERPLTLEASNMATYFSKDGTGIKLVWDRIETVINLIVEDANENVL